MRFYVAAGNLTPRKTGPYRDRMYLKIRILYLVFLLFGGYFLLPEQTIDAGRSSYLFSCR